MATNDKTTPAVVQPKPPSLSDTQARDQFIGIALRELIAKQVEDWKVNHEMAATLAVRYANAVMVARAGETAPLKVVVEKGKVVPPPTFPPSPALDPDYKDAPVPPVKSIAEIVGEAPELAEVK